MRSILVVGQIPPPFGGQAIMIQYMLDADYNGVSLYHVRMCFSKEMSDRGRFSLYKVIHLFDVILHIAINRFKYDIPVLYYPLSNSPRISIYRDFFILLCTRWLFKKTIYHFHASGICEELPKLGRLTRKLIFKVIEKPDLSITSSPFNPPDAEFLHSRNTMIIPLGIPDESGNRMRCRSLKSPITILFMGMLNSTKGELCGAEAISALRNRGYDIRYIIAGQFENNEYREFFFHRLEELGIRDYTRYLGVIKGDEKSNAFRSADIFCFPSFFSSESFGVVLLEAMQYGLPVISTKWRGIQSIVEDGKNGYLVPIRDSVAIANTIEQLITDPDKYSKMSQHSRSLFIEKYTLEKYNEALNKAFLTL